MNTKHFVFNTIITATTAATTARTIMNMLIYLLLLTFVVFANAKSCDFKKSGDDYNVEFKGDIVYKKSPYFLVNLYQSFFHGRDDIHCVGEWKMNSKNGASEYSIVYYGKIKNGKPHGPAENAMITHIYNVEDYVSADYYYIGNWENGYKSGNGLQQVILLDKNKNPIILSIQNGIFANNDIMAGSDFTYAIDNNVCSEYHGSFRNNRPHGDGIIHYNNGTIFEGEFVDGKIVKIDKSNIPIEKNETHPFSMEQLSTLSWNDVIAEIPTTIIQQYNCLEKMLQLQQKQK